MTTRLMTESDAGGIAYLEQQLFTDPWSEESIRETFRQTHSIIIVAVEQNTVIGYVIGQRIGDEAEILRLAVSKKRQQAGVGHILLGALKESRPDKQVRKILLDVRESNQNAIDFYLRNEFKKDGIRKDFYRFPHENAVLMSWQNS